MRVYWIPLICTMILVAVVAAGLSHYSSVASLGEAIRAGAVHLSPQVPVKTKEEGKPVVVASAPDMKQVSLSDDQQKKLFDSLMARLESLQNQNRDLLDQVAETNRDLMKLEFRVDTHSESFRPLTVEDPIEDATYQDVTGVLPPRVKPAEP